MSEPVQHRADTAAVDFGWPEVRHTVAGHELARLLDARPVAGLDDASLIDAATATQRLIGFYQARQIAVIAELHRRRQTETRPACAVAATAQTVAELMPALRQSRNRLHQRLQLATSLTRLPRVAGLFAAGRLEEYGVRCISEEFTALDGDAELQAVAEEELVDRLVGAQRTDANTALVPATSGEIATAARQVVAEADPGAFDHKHRRAFADRKVSALPERDGMAAFVLTHTGHDVDTAKHRLTQLARNLGVDDPRTIAQREADLAIDILTGRIRIDPCTSHAEEGEQTRVSAAHPRCRTHVNVSAPMQTLMGVSDAPGQTATGEPVPATLLRRIAAHPESTWFRMLTDPAGNLADLSTHAYRPAEPLWRATAVRDRVCIAPGCRGGAQCSDADHTLRHPDGDTSYANLGRPCRPHHRIKHHPGFGLTQTEPGVFRWTYPSGHTDTTRARPHPIAHWPTEWIEPDNATDLQAGLRLLHQHRRSQTRRGINHVRTALDEARLREWRDEAGDLDGRDPPDHDPERADLEATTEDYDALDQLLPADAT
ncbi:MAG: HNH endonuclease [Actinomycetota bacterium]|nr:HNH endonuclease [Actinomycetota bacterium]